MNPKWCNYPDNELGDATTPGLGCWGLLNKFVKSEEDCKDCELYKKLKQV